MCLQVIESIGQSLRTIGMALKTYFADANDALYKTCFDIISDYADAENVDLSSLAIWALGDVGVPPELVSTRLIELIDSPPKSSPDRTGTCRAVAFRMLARNDVDAAAAYRNHPAFDEFTQMLIDIRRRSLERYPDNKKLVTQVDSELAPWGITA